MPVTSAKPARVAERRRIRNAPLLSKAKTLINKANKLMGGEDQSAAEQAVKEAVIALDKAAQKGAIHPNNASRRKSRIMKRFQKSMDS